MILNNIMITTLTIKIRIARTLFMVSCILNCRKSPIQQKHFTLYIYSHTAGYMKIYKAVVNEYFIIVRLQQLFAILPFHHNDLSHAVLSEL